MTFFAVIKDNGCIAHTGASASPPPGHVPLPEGCTPEDEQRIMYIGGAWLPRPVLERDGLSFPVPVAWEVQDAETGAWLGGAVDTDLTLPDPGSYRIVVTPPEPYAPIEPFTVEIT